MTTLERFLVKKQVSKPLEESASEEIQKKDPNSHLASTISELKGIFPNESDENLMLLALQNQNPRDLEAAVHRMLENGNAFEVVKQGWNTVKSRDKKKPEQKKGYKQKKNYRTVEEINEEVPGYSRGKPHQKYQKSNKRLENDYRGSRKYESTKPEVSWTLENQEPKSEIFKPEEEQKIPAHGAEQVAKSVHEKPEAPTIEDKKEETKVKYDSFPSLESQPWDRTQSPPQEIRENRISNPPASITVEEDNKLPMEMSEKILSPTNSESIWKENKLLNKKPETKDFGVQVEMEYGIPIIVYPYMFQKK